MTGLYFESSSHFFQSFSDSGVSLGFASNYSGDFEVRANYGGFNPGNNVSSKLVSESGSSKHYAGKIGNGGNGNVTIRTNYGGISFN